MNECSIYEGKCDFTSTKSLSYVETKLELYYIKKQL